MLGQAFRITGSRSRGGARPGIGGKNLYLRYNERRKFKISCCCDGLSAWKLLITPLASELHFRGWKRS